LNKHLLLKVISVFGLVLLLAGLVPAQETEPVSVNEFVMAEWLTKQVQPIYPPLARSIGVQGTVSLTVHIGTDGTVLDMSLLSGHPLLVNAAREAVSQWQYKPLQVAGKPVEAITVVTVAFNLAGAAQTLASVPDINKLRGPADGVEFESSVSGRNANERATPPFPASVFTLLVYRKEGLYSSSAISEERAFQDLVAYVKGQWAKRFPLTVIPSSEEDAVDQYFDLELDPESYEIIEHELLK
jgi:TonB family protein